MRLLTALTCLASSVSAVYLGQMPSANQFGAWLAAGSDDMAWQQEVPANQLENVLQRIMQYENEAELAPRPTPQPLQLAVQQTQQALHAQQMALQAEAREAQLQARQAAKLQAQLKLVQPLKPGPQPVPEPEASSHASPPAKKSPPPPPPPSARPRASPRAVHRLRSIEPSATLGRPPAHETSLTSVQLTVVATVAFVGILFGVAVGTTLARRACRPQPPPDDEPVQWENDGDWAIDPDAGLCQRAPVRRVILPLLRRMVARQNSIFKL